MPLPKTKTEPTFPFCDDDRICVCILCQRRRDLDAEAQAIGKSGHRLRVTAYHGVVDLDTGATYRTLAAAIEHLTDAGHASRWRGTAIGVLHGG